MVVVVAEHRVQLCRRAPLGVDRIHGYGLHLDQQGRQAATKHRASPLAGEQLIQESRIIHFEQGHVRPQFNAPRLPFPF